MKIDHVVEKFTETYDIDAISSIDKLSTNFGLIEKERTISLFNMKTLFETFTTFITQYSGYVIENKNNPDAFPIETIRERTNAFINDGLKIKTEDVKYRDVNTFVKSYIENTEKLISTMDNLKESMDVEGVDADYIGDINEYVDSFIEKIEKPFAESMDKLLTASGYKFDHRSKVKKDTPQQVSFL